MDKVQLLLALSAALFSVGLLGLVIRRNLLVMLMFLELMLNGVIVSLVAFTFEAGSAAGAVLVFLVFVTAAAEVAIAVPIVVLLARLKHSLDPGACADLKG